MSSELEENFIEVCACMELEHPLSDAVPTVTENSIFSKEKTRIAFRTKNVAGRKILFSEQAQQMRLMPFTLQDRQHKPGTALSSEDGSIYIVYGEKEVFVTFNNPKTAYVANLIATKNPMKSEKQTNRHLFFYTRNRINGCEFREAKAPQRLKADSEFKLTA